MRDYRNRRPGLSSQREGFFDAPQEHLNVVVFALSMVPFFASDFYGFFQIAWHHGFDIFGVLRSLQHAWVIPLRIAIFGVGCALAFTRNKYAALAFSAGAVFFTVYAIWWYRGVFPLDFFYFYCIGARISCPCLGPTWR